MRKTILKTLGLLLCTSAAYSQQWGDYTLYSEWYSTSTFLLDTNGTVVKTWTHPSPNETIYSSYLMPGGTLVRSIARQGNYFLGGPISGQVQKVDYSGNIIWDFVYSTPDYCSHHDIHPLPNGNVLLIAYERKTSAEATQAGSSRAIEIWPDKIVEVQPTGATTGTVVWEWHAWDHLVQNVNPAKDNYKTSISAHPELLNINENTSEDWMHMNGLDYNPMLDQIAFSCHNLSEIYVIDHSTTTAEAASHSGGNSGKGGDILYRWGKPANYAATGADVLDVVHDAHWIPEGVPNSGRLVAFNNYGTNKSTVDQIDVPKTVYTYSSTNGAFTPTNFTKRLVTTGFTSNMGNSQQLPNGNQLVCLGMLGIIYEVNPAGATLWTKTVSGAVAQAFRYNQCYVSNAAPAIPVITNNGGVLSSSSATTYQWYHNGELMPGQTAQTLTPSLDGLYVVRITDNNGCVFQYSKGFLKGSIVNPVGIKEDAYDEPVKVYPNPGNGIVTVEYPATGSATSIGVCDVYGRKVMEVKDQSSLDLSALSAGVYYITVGTTTYSSTQKLIITH
jgi:hypothetical protein